MRGRRCAATLDGMELGFSSGDPLLVFDGSLTIRSWNRAAEALTGIPASEAIGRPCWQVLGAADERGVVCHRGCSAARLLREGREVATRDVSIRTTAGRRRVALASLAVNNGGAVYVHLLRAGAAGGNHRGLTPRELEVLDQLSTGVPVKRIAFDLGLAETTVRNHVRAVLRKLGCHSQLEAVARARRTGLVQP